MDVKKVFLIILLQGITTVVIFAAEKDFTDSRSAYFTTRGNKRIKGHVVKRFDSPSLLSCENSCLRNGWCTSTNFKTVSKNGEGTCELYKHEAINGNANFHDEQGVIFSKLLKVIHCF